MKSGYDLGFDVAVLNSVSNLYNYKNVILFTSFIKYNLLLVSFKWSFIIYSVASFEEPLVGIHS